MSNASRHNTLSTVEACVVGLIKQLTPDPEIACSKAFEKLGPLVRMAKSLTADDLPNYFQAGIQEVIQHLDAFRTGFARTYEQENGNSLEKASCFKPVVSTMTIAEFVKYADSTIRKAVKCVEGGAVSEALKALHTLVSDIRKAESFADTVSESISVTVDNDPMRIVETEAPGTMSPSGTSSPSTAASNYATNPGDIGGAAPSTAPNPATGSMTAINTAVPAGDSNFVAKGAEAQAAPAATPSPEAVAKAAAESISKSLDSIRKSVGDFSPDTRVEQSGWALDLNSPEFLRGQVPKERF